MAYWMEKDSNISEVQGFEKINPKWTNEYKIKSLSKFFYKFVKATFTHKFISQYFFPYPFLATECKIWELYILEETILCNTVVSLPSQKSDGAFEKIDF
jgi:hypothetical protein